MTDARPVGSPDLLLARRYRLLRPVAHRARTTLWRGVDEVLARTVAVKVLDDPAAVPGGAEAFVAAAVRAGRLAHPRIASTYDAAVEDGVPYIVSEWVEGHALVEMLRDGPLRPARATTVVAQVAEAVAAAHRHDVVHGDVDTHNVLVCADGAVKVTDFGVGAITAGATPATAADVEPVLADTRALGGLLYTCLTARSAAGAEPELAAAPRRDGRLLAPRQVRAGISRELEVVVMRVLDPAQIAARRTGAVSVARIETPAALVAALAPLPGEGPTADADELVDAPRPPRPARRLVRWGVPLATVSVVALLMLALGRSLGGTPVVHGRPPALPQATTSAGVTVGAALKPAKVTDFDPAGDGEESRPSVPLAYDGDTTTAWETNIYKNNATFGNLKPGVGLLVDMGSSVTVHRVDLVLSKPGLSLEIRAADAAGNDYTSMPVVASATDAKVSIALTPTAATPARYWLIWITKLVPLDNPADRFRGGVAEFVFRG